MINSKTILKDHILIVENVMTNFVCDMIINEYQNNDKILNENHIEELIFCSISRIIFNLRLSKNFGLSLFDKDLGYTLLKMSPNHLIKTEYLNLDKLSSLSCSIQLNENYEGGEFAFFDRELMIKTKPGSAIVFPSNFMYPHEIMPVIKGTRYSIVTWLV